jgi:hypothetical protein
VARNPCTPVAFLPELRPFYLHWVMHNPSPKFYVTSFLTKTRKNHISPISITQSNENRQILRQKSPRMKTERNTQTNQKQPPNSWPKKGRNATPCKFPQSICLNRTQNNTEVDYVRRFRKQSRRGEGSN